ncbi:MAG: B12-binding domain-containing radical SAM protein [Candidatus Goldbacteria bacterium]|nr:B12-binding domain-containing radical SAM protein [Candidatus Goldiibacteriota bacterium]
MKILLINPYQTSREGNIWTKIEGAMPPLGLAYIASYLESKGIDSEIIDMNVSQGDAKTQVDKIKETPDIIGITSMTSTIMNAYEIAKYLREKFPKAKIIFGGVHPTVLPEDVLSRQYIDYVIRGEGEYSFYKFITGGDIKNIPNLSYRENNKYVHNPSGPLIDNLDTLPMPAYYKLPIKKYIPTLGSYKRLPAISMIATRGCPGKCTFCFGSFLGEKIRMHSPDYLIEEIKFLQKNHGIKEILFYDDTFTTFRHKVKEFCNKIIEQKIDISWVCFSRVDTIDEETLKLMKKAGCHQIMYGIESGSEEILKNINKKVNKEKAKIAVQLTKKVGIECRTTYMLGNPGETEETIMQTVKFAIELDPDIALFNITTPFPGTAMFKWAKENGYLISEDWSKYDLSNMVMELPTISREKIQKYYKKVFKMFYLRPNYLLKRLFKIRSLNDLKMAFNAFLAVITH